MYDQLFGAGLGMIKAGNQEIDYQNISSVDQAVAMGRAKGQGIGKGIGTGIGALLTPFVGPAGVAAGGALGSMVGGMFGANKQRREAEEIIGNREQKQSNFISMYRDIANQNEQVRAVQEANSVSGQY